MTEDPRKANDCCNRWPQIRPFSPDHCEHHRKAAKHCERCCQIEAHKESR